MNTLCRLLGVATLILAGYVWFQTPATLAYDATPGHETASFLYTVSFWACIIGAIFWFAIAKILDNQDEIKRHLGIEDKKPGKSLFGGKVF